jgi:hypothetical protein
MYNTFLTLIVSRTESKNRSVTVAAPQALNLLSRAR